MKNLIKIITATLIMISTMTNISAKTAVEMDSSLKFKELDNGFKIYVYKNVEPPQRVSMRLVVTRGSLNESEEEQGIAHFLEHMAFKGTENFPAGEMVEYFQRLGMAFGADTNAHTSFDETVYKIDMPDVQTKHIKDGLMLFKDYASTMLLKTEDIEPERGVIIAEKVARDGAEYRAFQLLWQSIFGDTLYSKRFPIGLEDVINNADRQIFVDFYNENYAPENMSIVIVGDFDCDEIIDLATEYFSGLKPRAKVRANPSEKFTYAKASSDYKELFARAESFEFTDRELKNDSVKLMSVKNNAFEIDSQEKRKYYLKLALANYALSRRLDRISADEGSPITTAYVFSQVFFDLVSVNFIEAILNPKDSKESLQILARELACALKYGFYESEIKEAKEYYINELEQAIKEKSTRKTPSLASGIASKVSNGEAYTSPEYNLELAKQAFQEASLEDLNSLFNEQYKDSRFVSFISDTKAIDYSIKEVLNAVAKEEIKPSVEFISGEFAYADMSQSGEIVAEEVLKDLEITQLTLSNNIKVNLKQTKFSANSISVSMNFGNGISGFKSEKDSALSRLSSFLVQGGLKEHSYEDLQSIFAAKSMYFDFNTSAENFALGGYCASSDLTEFLLLLKAYVLHADFDETILPRIKKKSREKYAKVKTSPEGTASAKALAWLCNSNLRFGMPSEELVEASTAQEFKAWIEPYLKESYMEISIIGDFEEAELKELILKTFATLPARAKVPVNGDTKVDLQEAGSSVSLDFTSDKIKAMGLAIWETCPMQDIRKARASGLLSSILDDRMRLKIRKENSIVYSPFAYNRSDRVYNFGVLMAGSVVDVENIDVLLDLVSEVAGDLANGEITQDEFERAKLPIVKQIEKMRRTNAYWLESVLVYSQVSPVKLDWAKTIVSGFDELSLEELNSLSKEIFGKEEAYKIKVIPQKWEK